MDTTVDVSGLIARNLAMILEKKQISRRQLCTDTGIKYTTFCDWINGRTEPKLKYLSVLSKYLDVTIADFFIESESTDIEMSHLFAYAKHFSQPKKELSLEILSKLNDNEIKDLLDAGFSFKKLTLKEYSDFFKEPIASTEEVDWGEPMEDETW